MTIPANIKKNLKTKCVITRLMSILFSFQSRNFIKLNKSKIKESYCCSFLPVTKKKKKKKNVKLKYTLVPYLCKHERR